MNPFRRRVAALTLATLPAAALVATGPAPAQAWEGGPAAHGGGVVASGLDTDGVVSVPPAPPGAHAVAVTTSELYSVVVWSDGTVTPFGDDSVPDPEPCPPDPPEPCLDLPTPMFGGIPAPPAGQRYVGAASGSAHGLLLTDAGRLVGFGSDDFSADTPPALPAGLRWTGAAAGDRWSVALRSDGQAFGFGYNAQQRRDVPSLTGDLRYTDVAAGDQHGVALVSDGSLRTWGDSSDQRRNIFSNAGNGRTYLMVAASGARTAAVRSDGAVLAAGDDLQGVVANVPLGRTAVDLALGDDHGLVLLDNGTVVGFGTNDHGQRTAPSLDGSRRITALAAGGDHSLFLTAQSPTVEATPTVTVPYGSPAAYDVRVGTGQAPATGRLRTTLRGEPFLSTALDGSGRARVRVPAGLPLGESFLYAWYDGDARTAPSLFAESSVTRVTVIRAVPTITATRVGARPRPQQRGRFDVRVRAGQLPVGGTVVVREGKRVLTRARATVAKDGSVRVRLPRLAAGVHRLSVVYGGSAEARPATKAVTLRVRRR
jgi:hypothetical protein